MNQPVSSSNSLVTRVLWRIESDLENAPSLSDLADAEGVSLFHLSRAFSLVTGQPLIGYVRARRLSIAALQLAGGNCRVIEVALDAGYDSHEGFARAFRRHFGIAPSEMKKGLVPDINLQEALQMTAESHPKLTPEFIERPAIRLAGEAKRYKTSQISRIPAQWQSLDAEFAQALSQGKTYGVNYGFEDDAFNYMIGFEEDGVRRAEGFEKLGLPGGKYAVFRHDGHISEIGATWEAIFEAWAPSAGVQTGEGPEFEEYEHGFDPMTPGGVSIWIPVQTA